MDEVAVAVTVVVDVTGWVVVTVAVVVVVVFVDVVVDELLLLLLLLFPPRVPPAQLLTIVERMSIMCDCELWRGFFFYLETNRH